MGLYLGVFVFITALLWTECFPYSHKVASNSTAMNEKIQVLPQYWICVLTRWSKLFESTIYS